MISKAYSEIDLKLMKAPYDIITSFKSIVILKKKNYYDHFSIMCY